MEKKRFYDGKFRIYDSDSDKLLYSFILNGYPTASSLEKIRANIVPDSPLHYVTLELKMYEIEVPA